MKGDTSEHARSAQRLISFCLIGILATVSTQLQAQVRVRGAGATIVAELLRQWTDVAAVGVVLDYAGSGSGAGRREISEGRIDFAASEQPFSDAELQKLNLRQFPISFTAIVPVYNLPGVATGLRLDGRALAAVFSGRTRTWNDPAIASLNPGVVLPVLAVKPVVRADSSGSTFAFTTFLASADPQWTSNIGVGTTVKWPLAERAEGTGGVARLVATTPGAIGYVALNAAQRASLSTARVATPVGVYVAANVESVAAAVRVGEWRKHLLDEDPPFDASLINLPTQNAWPITTATYVIMPRRARNTEAARAALRLFQWALDSGVSVTTANGFLAVDDKLAFKIKLAWRVALQDAQGAPLLR